MARALRILLVTRNFPPSQGGIETMALELARHASANGTEMRVAHFGQNPCRGIPAGIAGYHHLPGPGKWSTLALSAVVIPWLVLRRRPDLVVNMQVTTALGSLLASLILRVPYTVIGLGLEVLPPRGGPAALSWRALALRGAKRVVSISRFTDGLVGRFGVPASRREVVNLGTRQFTSEEARRDRDAAFGPVREGTFVCLTLSRLVPRKGVDKALEALARVVARRKDILYCIGGAGPDRPRLESMAASLDLQDHVRFLGRIPDEKLGLCYASADLFVLPSRTSDHPPDAEGFGIVFLEAGACGTPSLGGASGGIPDAIDDGVTGFLVDPMDPEAIAERVLRLMDDRELLGRMGAAARARARASTWERAAEAYFRAFRA